MEHLPNEVSEGHLPFSHGSVFWKLNKAATVSKPPSLKPTLLMIHAGVADHTLWDGQVAYFTSEGWSCLRFDLFGFGKSLPSQEYLTSEPREPIDNIEIVNLVKLHVLPEDSTKVVVVGLSMGGGLAVDYILAHPESVAGLVVVAGGLSDFEGPQNAPEEEALFDEVQRLIDLGEIASAAALQVHIWADGPFQRHGRFLDSAGATEAERMAKWNLDICQREQSKRGGSILPTKESNQPALKRLHEITVPSAIAYGEFDETYTTETMKYLGSKLRGSLERNNEGATFGAKPFPTAHMINLEVPDEFNIWLKGFLDALEL